MNVTIHMQRAPSVLATVALFALLATGAAFAHPVDTGGMVATNLGSQDPRDTVRSEYPAGLVPSRLGSPDPRSTANESLPAELRGPVRPDGAALRAVFSELAAQASSNRAAVKVEAANSGFSWRDAAVGGGVTLLVVALVGLVLAMTAHRSKKLIRV
jgi:hypothetical protein